MIFRGEKSILAFLRHEAIGGILLMLATAVALAVANSPLGDGYRECLQEPVSGLSLRLWINDGLMALFFLVIGLELKREFLRGELSDNRKRLLPVIGAAGGMLVPALVYVAFNAAHPGGLRGWAIPTATDIAFALGVLMLLGSRIPVGLRIFLTSLAIFDDLGAILVIALFYVGHLSILAIAVAGACIGILYVFNRQGVESLSAYLAVGIVLWIALLNSGIHATLAGVLLALFIPLHSQKEVTGSPLENLEDGLHPWVIYGVLPLFAFANAGVNLHNIGWQDLLHPVPLGVTMGLLIGKQLGVFLSCALAIRCGMAELPTGACWRSFYGTAVLCGIGFTMSLFIGGLAFPADTARVFDERLGILLGSLLAGIWGYVILVRTDYSDNDSSA